MVVTLKIKRNKSKEKVNIMRNGTNGGGQDRILLDRQKRPVRSNSK